MPITALKRLPLTFDLAKPRGKLFDARHHHAPLARRHRLVAEETKGSHITESADMPSVQRRTQRFRAVFDKLQTVLAGEVGQCLHVTNAAVQMNGHDRLRFRADLAPNIVDIDQPVVRPAVDEHRRGPGLGNRIDRRDVSERRHDHLVPWPDV